MYSQCDRYLNDFEIVEQLRDEIKSRKFSLYNLTSIKNLFIYASGYYGIEIRVLSFSLLISYQKWLETHSNYILLERYNPVNLSIIIEKIKNNNITYQDKDLLEIYLKNINLENVSVDNEDKGFYSKCNYITPICFIVGFIVSSSISYYF